jgi:hypothetical protein
MMTVDIPATLRQIIDARLDNIERALMSQGVARGDRRQILSAIEDQILEMLGQVAGEEPTRDDVLSVLAKLDPPEAYLDCSSGEFSRVPPLSTGVRRNDAGAVRPDDTKKSLNVLAVISFVLTCIATFGSFVWWMLSLGGLLPLAAVTIGAGVCGTIALCQFISNRQHQSGLWMAITATSCAPVIGFLSWLAYVLIEAF